MKLSLVVADAGRPFADFERAADQLPGIAPGPDFTDQRIDRMFLESLELCKAGDRHQVSIRQEEVNSVPRGPLGDPVVKAFTAPDEGSKNLDNAARRELLDGGGDGGERLLFNGHAAIGTVLGSEL